MEKYNIVVTATSSLMQLNQSTLFWTNLYLNRNVCSYVNVFFIKIEGHVQADD